MAKSVNKVILVGNVGQDPEVKYTASGVPVAKVSLATNERFKDRNDQWQDRTEWHSVVAWQQLAEIVGEYIRKGQKLYVKASCRHRPGKTGRTAKRNIEQRLSLGTLSCSVRGITGRKAGEKCPTGNLVRSPLPQ